MQWLYLALAILGTALPLGCLAPFLAAHGLDLPLLFRQLFQTSVSAFFGADVIVSALVLFHLHPRAAPHYRERLVSQPPEGRPRCGTNA